MTLERVFTPALGRDVFLRPGTSDRQVWTDTFTGLYHVPPASMPAPRTVLDLGANIGLTTAHYARLWPEAEIVAVEMDRGNGDLAVRNTLLGSAGDKVTVVHNAVSDAIGAEAYDADASADAFSLGVGAQVVQCLTLRHIIEWRFCEDGFEGADFVKMDVEGMEWRLLEHGSEWVPLVRHLLVELHGPGAANDLVVAAMSKLAHLGFEVLRHLPHPQAVFAARR